MTKVFLADTYALIELIGGNNDYKPHLENVLITTKLHLTELYYCLLKDYDKETADKYFKVYSKYLISVSFSSIASGMEFKLQHKKDKLSYADCIGYAMAQELGVRFLTGDEKFENLKNVEFVK